MTYLFHLVSSYSQNTIKKYINYLRISLGPFLVLVFLCFDLILLKSKQLHLWIASQQLSSGLEIIMKSVIISGWSLEPVDGRWVRLPVTSGWLVGWLVDGCKLVCFQKLHDSFVSYFLYHIFLSSCQMHSFKITSLLSLLSFY